MVAGVGRLMVEIKKIIQLLQRWNHNIFFLLNKKIEL